MRKSTTLAAVQISEHLPKSPSSAGRARRVLDRLAGDVDARALDDARLLVTELVANAVKHVQEDGEIDLLVDLHEGVLYVALTDPGPGFEPAPRRPDAPTDSGWGLHFTQLLAERWGAERHGRVWFEVPTR